MAPHPRRIHRLMIRTRTMRLQEFKVHQILHLLVGHREEDLALSEPEQRAPTPVAPQVQLQRITRRHDHQVPVDR